MLLARIGSPWSARFSSVAASCGFMLLASMPPAAHADSGFVLYSTEGNRLRRIDVDTIASDRLIEEVLIQAASEGEFSGATGADGRDVNGNICSLPDGSGRFVLGEDTGQPNPPAGWGIFEADGTQVGKLTATYQPGANPEPHGCAIDPNTGALYTSDVGVQGFGAASGQLIKWFGPYDRFPGPPGAYPDTNASSSGFCKIAIDIGTAAEVLVDGTGDIFVSASGGLQLLRFRIPAGKSLDPGDPAGGCTATDPQGSPLVDASVTGAPDFRTVLVAADPKMITFSGLALAPNGNLYVASVLTGRIAEYRVDGTFVRFILDPPEPGLGANFTLPIATGNPQGIDVDGDGTLYYADLDLRGTLPDVRPGSNGKVRRIRFDVAGDPLPPEIVREFLAFPDGVAIFPGDLQRREWTTLAGGPDRRFFQSDELILDSSNVSALSKRWEVPTGAVITASPTVALVDVPGEGLTQVVYFLSWDLSIYAVRLEDGSVLWKVATENQPGASFPATASVHVQRIDDRDQVFVGQGEIFYALDATTGAEIWRFVVGTGCRDDQGNPPGLCGFDGERNQIESSAIIAEGKVFFGMDVNDVATGKGGFAALDVHTGKLAWWFDLESGQTCHPLPTDNIRAYDSYHSESELGLPDDFFATRPGCDHPRTPNGCGNVWSSPAYDAARGQLFIASSNCDMPIDPSTGEPFEMPPFDEAIFSLTTDGDVAWVWRPRAFDNEDLAYGGTPNLFQITLEVGGAPRTVDVVGVGNKDGSYTVLDRNGVNRQNGARWNDDSRSHLPADLPYWSTRVVAGGDIGGVLSTASVDAANGQVTFCTAPGSSVANTPPGPSQTPTLHALDLDTGSVLWQSGTTACFSSVSGFADVALIGTALGANLRSIDAASGAQISAFDLTNFGMGSAATVIDGTILIGAGIGTRTSTGSGPADFAANLPSKMTALCVPGTAGCAACNDGVDNDGDGRTDAPADDGCVSLQDDSEVLGDLDYDGVVGDRDRNRFFAAFGRVPGQPGYSIAADLDPPGAPNGRIDLVDYQRWIAAEVAANAPPPVVLAAPPPLRCGLIGLEVLLVPALVALRRRWTPSRSRRLAGLLTSLLWIALFSGAPSNANAAVTLALAGDRPLVGGELQVLAGQAFYVDVIGQLTQPIVGFGVDLIQTPAGVIAPTGVTISGGFIGVNASDGDGLAGLAAPPGVAGSNLLLARIAISALAPGLTNLRLGASVGDFAEGFALAGIGAFDTVDFGNTLAVRVIPEPGTALLLGLGLGVLAGRRHRFRGERASRRAGQL